MKAVAIGLLLTVLVGSVAGMLIVARNMALLQDLPPPPTERAARPIVRPQRTHVPPVRETGNRLSSGRAVDVPAPGGDPAGGTETGTDVIPGEYVMTFFSAGDRDAMAAAVREAGGTVLGELAIGHAIRIWLPDDAVLDRLLREAPRPVDFSANHRVRLPLPPEAQPKPADPRGYLAFGPHLLDWLGLDGDRSGWGRGVTIAVLDTGMSAYAGLPESHITRIGLTGQPGSGTADPVGHGTAIGSLLLGAESGVPGLVPEVDLLSIQVFADDPAGDAFTVAKGIVEAVNRGARVISLSLGSRGDNVALRDAVTYALDRGVAVVAAVGNDGVEGVLYPARYEGVVGVAAIDANAQHLYFSNRGPEVDVAAPGLGLRVARPDDAHGYFSGTSAAAPLVGGAVALLLSQDPALTVNAAVDLVLGMSSDEGEAGDDPEYGEGFLDVERMLQRDNASWADVAALNAFLRPGGDERRRVVMVGAQNRGQADLPMVVVNAEVNGRLTTREFRNLRPGATVFLDVPIMLDPTSLDPAAVSVAHTVTAPGVPDARPANNARRTVLYATED